MFSTVLVANRGEIARRVFATCRRLGLSTVAVFSDVDEGSAHVAEADRSVRLPGTSPAETYLNVERLIEAAQAADADAVHPGYGFLSENAAFAQAVLDAGLVWIGPTPAAIRSMGSKVNAKQLMATAGVPVLPELEPGQVTAADLPILIKASAGGGGRGMRVVSELAELSDAISSAATEAARAFGDGQVFCERYLAGGHHLEVQLLADEHDQVWALTERECSIQRRHQKVLEETPSPLAERVPGLRTRLLEASVKAARAIGYRGAGTVEFIVDDDGNAYFLEMNTRLQVEHPVTEAVTGLDLVEWQLRIAEGQPLPSVEPPPSRGHAIEVRLYAEDPAQDGQPQTGPISRFELPEVDSEFRAGGILRLDSGVRAGDVVSPYYDSMLAKLISFDTDRAVAARRLAGVLGRARLHGPITNRDQLIRVLTDEEFRTGRTTTALLERPELSHSRTTPELEALCAVAAALADSASPRTTLGGLPSGWRNVVSQPQRRSFDGPGGRHDVYYRLGRSSIDIEGFSDVRVVSVTTASVLLERAGVRQRLLVFRDQDKVFVDADGGSVTLVPVPRFTDPAAAVPFGSLLAPLPGSVLRLAVAPGQSVRRGEPLLWIEAMKMEHPVTATVDGVVAEVAVAVGDQVSVGELLAVLEPADQTPAALTPADQTPVDQ